MRARLWFSAALLMLATPAALADEVEKKPAFVERGEASWYGPGFEGRPTASGDPFDQDGLTAAHPDLPLGSQATVTNLENGRSVQVEINDRGPYVEGRAIDLSRGAAARLGMVEDGTAPVRIEADAPAAASANEQLPKSSDAGAGRPDGER